LAYTLKEDDDDDDDDDKYEEKQALLSDWLRAGRSGFDSRQAQ
jgi:hypothetical protein